MEVRQEEMKHDEGVATSASAPAVPERTRALWSVPGCSCPPRPAARGGLLPRGTHRICPPGASPANTTPSAPPVGGGGCPQVMLTTQAARNHITSGLEVAQDMICSSSPEAHLLLSWKQSRHRHHQQQWSINDGEEALGSPSAEPFRPLPPAPCRERRRNQGRWRRGPEPQPPSRSWRSSPARPTRWSTTQRCRTRADSAAGRVGQAVGRAAGPGGGPRPARPGTACRGCGPAARHRPREAGGEACVRTSHP